MPDGSRSDLDMIVATGLRTAGIAVRHAHPELNLDEALAQSVAATALSAVHSELAAWAARDAERRRTELEEDRMSHAALVRFAAPDSSDMRCAVHAAQLSAATDAGAWIRGAHGALIPEHNLGFIADNVSAYILAAARERAAR